MLQIPAISKWPGKAAEFLNSSISLVVFALLDLLEIVFCVFYRVLDALLEGNNSHSPCYCEQHLDDGRDSSVDAQVSETLYQRKNIFRDLGLLNFGRNRGGEDDSKDGLILKKRKGRWSDCSCQSCSSWQLNGDQKLHVVILEPSQGKSTVCNGKSAENVILLHGFLSSSSFWTESVFPNLSETGKQNCRFFAVDLFGFGKSPKPWDSLYTLKDHVEMIEKSVIAPFHLDSFHLVAHSMGCIVALAMAAKYLPSVKSITLIAPPYFPASMEKPSLNALNRLAERKLWPPLLFGSSFMSWYEHLGRSVCFIICRNHKIWEGILKLVTRRRDLHFAVVDLTRHTHHSAWHSMHNVICGGAKHMDEYLEAIKMSGTALKVIQGDKDQVVPLECIYNVKLKVPDAEVKTISNANHSTVIFGREKQFTTDLENMWLPAMQKCHAKRL